MINIQDYLHDDDGTDFSPSPDDGELLEFNEEPSRQEIGRWVDKLMDLSEDHPIEGETGLDDGEDDPYHSLAQILISNDLV